MARRGRGKNRHHNRGEGRQDQSQQRQDRRQPGSQNQRLPEQDDLSRPRPERSQHGKSSFTSITQPRRQLTRPMLEAAVAPSKDGKSYKVVFFDTLGQARSDLENLRVLASTCDQLNIVVRAEGPMDDADLNNVGKLFCGAAWALIHERRKTDGWYESAHE